MQFPTQARVLLNTALNMNQHITYLLIPLLTASQN